MLWPLTADGRLGRYTPGAAWAAVAVHACRPKQAPTTLDCRDPLASLVTMQYTFCKAAVHVLSASSNSAPSGHQLAGGGELTVATLGRDAAVILLYRLTRQYRQ